MTGYQVKSNQIINYFDELFPDPICELNYKKDYELVIAVMLSAQSTDKTVNKVTTVLFQQYPSLEALNNADIEDIKKIIKPAGSYNIKANNIKDICAKLLSIGGQVPLNHEFLTSLNGVGRKTANVVLSELYNYPAIAVDTHVTRVSKRLSLVKEKDSVQIIEQKLMKKIPKELWSRFHLQMVLFGRYHCQAKKPLCEKCKLTNICKEKR